MFARSKLMELLVQRSQHLPRADSLLVSLDLQLILLEEYLLLTKLELRYFEFLLGVASLDGHHPVQQFKQDFHSLEVELDLPLQLPFITADCWLGMLLTMLFGGLPWTATTRPFLLLSTLDSASIVFRSLQLPQMEAFSLFKAARTLWCAVPVAKSPPIFKDSVSTCLISKTLMSLLVVFCSQFLTATKSGDVPT